MLLDHGGCPKTPEYTSTRLQLPATIEWPQTDCIERGVKPHFLLQLTMEPLFSQVSLLLELGFCLIFLCVQGLTATG